MTRCTSLGHPNISIDFATAMDVELLRSNRLSSVTMLLSRATWRDPEGSTSSRAGCHRESRGGTRYPDADKRSARPSDDETDEPAVAVNDWRALHAMFDALERRPDLDDDDAGRHDVPY